VPVLCPDLQDDHLGLCLRQELLHVVQDHVDAVGGEDAVADATVFLDPNVKDAGTKDKLAVYGEGLALGEGASDEGDADFVGGRVVRSRPHDLVDAEFLWVQTGHPVFPVLGAVVGARVLFTGRFQIGENFLLCLNRLSPFHLFRHLRTHLHCSATHHNTYLHFLLHH